MTKETAGQEVVRPMTNPLKADRRLGYSQRQSGAGRLRGQSRGA